MTLITFITLNFLGKKTKLPLDEVIDKILVVLYPKRFKFFFGFFVAFTIILSLIYFKAIGYNYFVIYLLIFFCIQMLAYLFLHKKESGEVDIPNFYGLLILGVSLSTSLYLLARHDIQEVENSNSNTTIILDNSSIDLNAQTKNLYIGKTSKFVFIKIDSLNSTTVLPVEQVKQYKFQ